MGRINKDGISPIDTACYTDLGEMIWQQALREAYSPGVDTVAFDPDMFRKAGMAREITRHKSMDRVTVVYDRQYVYYRLFNMFIKKLGVLHDGVFNDELYNLLMSGLKEYALNEQQRDDDNKIRDAAKALDAKIPGNGVEYWYQVIKDQQGKVSNEATETEQEDILATTHEALQNEVSDVNSIAEEIADGAVDTVPSETTKRRPGRPLRESKME